MKKKLLYLSVTTFLSTTGLRGLAENNSDTSKQNTTTISSPKKESGPKAIPDIIKYGLFVSTGINKHKTYFTYGNAKDFDFYSYDAAFMGEHYLYPNPSLVIPISVGISWYVASTSVAINSRPGESLDAVLTYSSTNLRLASGIKTSGKVIGLPQSYQLTATPFFDYGIKGAYQVRGIESEDVNSGLSSLEYRAFGSYPFESFIRYGAILGIQYANSYGLKAGINTEISGGSFSVANNFVLGSQKKATFFGYGANISISWFVPVYPRKK